MFAQRFVSGQITIRRPQVRLYALLIDQIVGISNTRKNQIGIRYRIDIYIPSLPPLLAVGSLMLGHGPPDADLQPKARPP
jgi:hypothetical protein